MASWRTHNDVPPFIRQQLYAEEQQRRNRNSGKASRPAGGAPAVIVNILPGPRPTSEVVERTDTFGHHGPGLRLITGRSSENRGAS